MSIHETSYTKSSKGGPGVPNRDDLAFHRQGIPADSQTTIYFDAGTLSETRWDISSTWTAEQHFDGPAPQVEPGLRYAPLPEPFRIAADTQALKPVITEIRAVGISFSNELIPGGEMSIIGVNPDKEKYLVEALIRCGVIYQKVSAGKGGITPTRPLTPESESERSGEIRRATQSVIQLIDHLIELKRLGVLQIWLRDNADEVQNLRDWLEVK